MDHMNHSDLIGGSSAKRRIQCTGSAALEAQFPNEVASEAATEGTALHALVCQAMTIGPPARDDKPHVVVFEDWDEDGEAFDRFFEVSPEVMRDKFWSVFDALLELIQRYEIVNYSLEQRHTLHVTCGPEVFGTMDFAGRTRDGRAILADFKFGLGTLVDPKENDQLAFYATGLRDNRSPHLDGVEDLIFVILQPSPFPDGDVCKEWHTSTLWLDLWRNQLRRAYQRIKDNDTSYKAGDWCQFCRGAPACPTRNEAMLRFSAAVKVPDLPAGLSVAQIAYLLDVGSVAVQQFAVVAKYAEKLAQTGTSIPGWKLKESLGHRAFMNERLAEDVAVRLLGTEAYAPKALKTPAQLEKTAKALKVDFTPLADLLHRPSRGGRLVPDTDPAPAMPVATGRIELPAEIINLANHRKTKE
jgi:hypothetical protein